MTFYLVLFCLKTISNDSIKTIKNMKFLLKKRNILKLYLSILLMVIFFYTIIYPYNSIEHDKYQTKKFDDLKDEKLYQKQNIKYRSVEKSSTVKKQTQSMTAKLGIVMFGCNRTLYMTHSLDKLLQIKAKTQKRFKELYSVSNQFMSEYVQLPIILSMDCHYLPTLSEMFEYYKQGDVLKVYDFDEINYYETKLYFRTEKHLIPYYRLTMNYKLAFENIFHDYPTLEQLIVVEDDLGYSDDFLEYFIAFSSILKQNKELFCLSAWNDNGKDELMNKDKDYSLLRHTDFFPGLGWMLNKDVWEKELHSVWPEAFWDDWIRGQMKGRTCIQPIKSRTETFGKKGTSNGQYFETHLIKIKASEKYVPFYKLLNTYIETINIQTYRKNLLENVYNQSLSIHPSVFAYQARMMLLDKNKSYKMIYFTRYQFVQYSQHFGLMSDTKWGIPRGALDGIVSFTHKGYNVHLAPPESRKIYIKNWS